MNKSVIKKEATCYLLLNTCFSNLTTHYSLPKKDEQIRHKKKQTQRARQRFFELTLKSLTTKY